VSADARRRAFLGGFTLAFLTADEIFSSGTTHLAFAGGPAPPGPPSGVTRVTRANTSTGRRGAYYIPAGPPAIARPLLTVLHGTGGSGSRIIVALRDLADRHGFIVVAPDAVSVAGVWTTAQRANEVTADHRHIMACVREVAALPGVHVDRSRVLIAGYSVGGGAAASLATHEDLFTAFAVLHGHVPGAALGPRRVRGWLSTGDRDRSRTVGQIQATAEYLGQRQRFPDIEMRVFRGDHALQPDELAALVAWWLKPAG
jgi:poly(3-hydroxybutyrate) depolymerase